MTRAELEVKLAECEGHTPGPWVWNENSPDMIHLAADPVRVIGEAYGDYDEEHYANSCLIALAPALASALRKAWWEIDQLKAEMDSALYKALVEDTNPSLDSALNEGDGSYKP